MQNSDTSNSKNVSASSASVSVPSASIERIERQMEKLSLVVSKMTQHYADNLVKNPESFKKGLGKSCHGKKKNNNKKKGKKIDNEKRKKKRVRKESKFLLANAQGPVTLMSDIEAIAEGPVEWLTSKVSNLREGVASTLKEPVDELLTYLRDEDIGQSIRNIAQTAKNGSFKVLFGLDKDTVLPALVLLLALSLPLLTRNQILALVALLSLLAMFSEEFSLPYFGDTLSYIQQFVGFGKVQAQSDLDFEACYKFAMTCFAMWNMRIRYGDEATSFEKIHSCSRSFKVSLAKAEDLSDTFGHVQGLIRDSIEFLNKLLGLEISTEKFKGETWFEIEELNKNFIELKERYEKRDGLHTVAAKLMTLEKHGLGLINRFRVSSPAYQQYRDAMYRITALRDELAKLGCYGNSVRQEPLFVLVSGQAGVGKSTVSKYIQSVMVKEICGAEGVTQFIQNDSGSYVYAPNQESKFLDGYSNQPIVLLDDFAASTEATQIWTSNLIHLVNTQPHQTAQASLERKGAVYFDSKLILATSNVTAFAGVLNHMHSKQAVGRRMHVSIKVEVKDQFAMHVQGETEPMQDPVKVQAYRTQHPNAPEGFWLKFSWFDVLTGVITPMCQCGRECIATEECAPASLQTVLELIVKIYRARKSYEDQQKQRDRRHLQALISDDDTLDSIKKVFTQSSGCNNRFCYACARSHESRAFAYEMSQAEARDLLPTQEMEFIAHISDVPEEMAAELTANVISREHYRDCYRKMTTSDAFATAFGIGKTKYRPECIEKMRKDYVWVHEHTPKQFVLDYSFATRMWLAGSQASTLVEYANATKFAFHSFMSKTLFEKLYAFGKVVAVMGTFVGFAAALSIGSQVAFGRSKKRRKAQVGALSVLPQSVDVQHDQVVKSLLSSNVLYMKDGDAFCGYAFGIGGPLVLMNKHVYNSIVLEHSNLTFCKKTTASKKFEFTVTTESLRVFESDSDDLVCVNVKGFHCQNVVRHVSDDVHPQQSFNARLSYWAPDNDGVQLYSSSGFARAGRPIAAEDSEGNTFISVNTIEYDIPTENGQCGAIVTRVDATKASKIVGLHAAGSKTGNQGFGIVLKKDYIKRCFEHFETPVIQYDATTDIQRHFEFNIAPKEVPDNVQVCGKATPIAAVYKSEIKKSPFYGKLSVEPQKRPAYLNPFMKEGKLWDPVSEALTGYSRGGVLCNTEVLDAACDAYISEMINETVKPKSALLTFEEAVQGNKEKMPWVKPINRGTAAGSPSRFNDDVGNNKRKAFGDSEVYTFDTPGAKHIKEQVEQMIESLKKGPVPMVFTAFPKDELRPTEKAKAGKTRVVFSSDVVSTIVIRMYFSGFADWYQNPDNRYKNSSAVGMNVSDQFECKSFVEKMGAGDADVNVYAGDHSGFDKNLPSYVIDKVWNVYEAFMGPLLSEEQKTIARNIFISFTKPMIQYKDCLIEWDNSNPSGNPITTILNTICNNITLRYAVARSLGCSTYKEAKAMLVKLYRNRVVEYVCYGDDNVWKVNKRLIKEYGTATITYASVTKAFLELGMVYTDEVKSDHFDEGHRSVFEVGFLKRTMRLEKGAYLFQLSLDTLVQNIQWMKKKDIDGELFTVKVEGFLDELAVHDEQTWTKWHSEFYSVAREVDPRYHLKVDWAKSQAVRRSDFLARGCEYW